MKYKKIFVTGSGGFIGSHLVDKLLTEGYSVTALIKYNSNNDWGFLNKYKLQTNKNLKIILGDVRDLPQMTCLIKGSDVVIHLAALIGIPYSYKAYNSYFDTNLTGTLNILKSSIDNKIKRILTFSTSEVYGTAKYTPIDEEHQLIAQSPYSASKIAADKLCESFILSFRAPITIVRPFNTFGPRQSMRAVIPDIINQIYSNKKYIELGNIKTRRDFVYVSDTVNGVLDILNSNKTLYQTINIASGKSYSIKEIYEKLKNITNIEKKLIIKKERVRPDKSEVLELLGSNKKIKKLTKWKIKNSFDAALSKTADWNFKNKTYTKKITYTI